LTEPDASAQAAARAIVSFPRQREFSSRAGEGKQERAFLKKSAAKNFCDIHYV